MESAFDPRLDQPPTPQFDRYNLDTFAPPFRRDLNISRTRTPTTPPLSSRQRRRHSLQRSHGYRASWQLIASASSEAVASTTSRDSPARNGSRSARRSVHPPINC